MAILVVDMPDRCIEVYNQAILMVYMPDRRTEAYNQVVLMVHIPDRRTEAYNLAYGRPSGLDLAIQTTKELKWASLDIHRRLTVEGPQSGRIGPLTLTMALAGVPPQPMEKVWQLEVK
jgi:hypothetical protein